MTEKGRRCLTDGVARLMRFRDDNPAFDSLIVSPLSGEKIHLTFLETRYSQDAEPKDEGSAERRREESLKSYRHKRSMLVDAVSRLQTALSKEEGLSLQIEWHFVFAIYRDHGIARESIHSNTILLDRVGLNKFYGPSLSGLGML